MSGPRIGPGRIAGFHHGEALRAGAMVAAALLVAACGSSEAPAEEAPAGDGSSAQAGACGGLELSAVAEILACNEVRIVDAVEEASAVHCVTSCSDDPDRGLAYGVETFADADIAEAVLAGMRAAVSRTGAVRQLSDVGDSAWASDGPAAHLAARAGDTIVEVTLAPDPETRRRAAAALLERR